MRIAIGSDHAGFPLKAEIIKVLEKNEHKVKDFGCYDDNPIDFPDITLIVCKSVLNNEMDKAVMVCGTGAGACIAANKIPGIRAAVCHDVYTAHQCVEHDNVNVLCMGTQIVGSKLAEEILLSFLNAEFSNNEEFRRRVEKLNNMDKIKYQ